MKFVIQPVGLVTTISQGGSLPRRRLSMLKKLPVPSLSLEAAEEPGEDHTPDTHGHTPVHSEG